MGMNNYLGGLALGAASPRPRFADGGVVATTAAPAVPQQPTYIPFTGDPYTYALNGGEHLFFKPEPIAATPFPGASVTPVTPNAPSGDGGSGIGGSGMRADGGHSGGGGNVGSVNAPEGWGAGDVATAALNGLGIIGFGLPAAIGLGYGIANNKPDITFTGMLRDAWSGLTGGGLRGDVGYDGPTDGDSIGNDTLGRPGDGSIGSPAGWGGGLRGASSGSSGDSGRNGSEGQSGSAGGHDGGAGSSNAGGDSSGHRARGGLIRAEYASGGLVHGPGGGQDDLVPADLYEGSYVIPADILAHLGDGSAAEGSVRLRDAVGGLGQGMPQYARGGLSAGRVPAMVSASEEVIEPSVVTGLGGGDVERGGRRLDGFVKNVRKHKTSAKSGHPPKAKPAHSYMPRGKA